VQSATAVLEAEPGAAVADERPGAALVDFERKLFDAADGDPDSLESIARQQRVEAAEAMTAQTVSERERLVVTREQRLAAKEARLELIRQKQRQAEAEVRTPVVWRGAAVADGCAACGAQPQPGAQARRHHVQEASAPGRTALSTSHEDATGPVRYLFTESKSQCPARRRRRKTQQNQNSTDPDM
jgi:hypothetical protein